MKKAFLFFIFSLSAWGFDNPHIMRSPRGLLMGDAFTAVNDDAFTLFYNPASLARHKRDLTLYPFQGVVGGTNVIGESRFSDLPEDPGGIADQVLNYPVHLNAGMASGFKLFNFGVTFIANESIDLLLRNRTQPMMDLDMRSDRGVIFGLGIPIGPDKIGRHTHSGSQTSLGISAKYMERTGVRDTLSLTGGTLLNAMSQDEMRDILNSLGRVKGIGWGFDAGVEHVVKHGNFQMVTGLAALDITGTSFTVHDNPEQLAVANNRNQFNFGIAGGQSFTGFNYILSADVRSLTEEMDFGKRLRLGGQIGIPGLKLMGGFNSGYYSYGATVDLAFMQLTAGFYDIELGSQYRQIKSRRLIIYLSLFDFSFDA